MRSLLSFWFLIFCMFSSWIPLRTFLHHWYCGIARWYTLAGLFSFIAMDTQRYLLTRKFILVSSVLGNFLYCFSDVFFSIIFCFPFLELLLVGCWTSKIDFWLLYFCSCCPSLSLALFCSFWECIQLSLPIFYWLFYFYYVFNFQELLCPVITYFFNIFYNILLFFMCNLFSVWILNISYFENFFLSCLYFFILFCLFFSQPFILKSFRK